MLKEYMRRLIVERPTNPLKFLISSITEKPFVPTPKVTTQVPTTEGDAPAPDASSSFMP